MANRTFGQFQGALEKGVVMLFGQFTIGAAGAVSAYSGMGITSITKLADTGEYRVTLQDNYNSLLQANMTREVASGTSANYGHLIQVATVASGIIEFRFVDGSGVAAVPPSGAIQRVALFLKNSTV